MKQKKAREAFRILFLPRSNRSGTEKVLPDIFDVIILLFYSKQPKQRLLWVTKVPEAAEPMSEKND